MARPYMPRSAVVLSAIGLVLLILAVLALATDQPISLALGLALGIHLGTVVMLGEVRKARGD